MTKSDLKLDLELDWHRVTGALIYIVWRGDECLYVGNTKNGFGRTFYTSHVVLGKRGLLAQQNVIPTHVGIEYAESEAQAIRRQNELITKLKPTFNKMMRHDYPDWASTHDDLLAVIDKMLPIPKDSRRTFFRAKQRQKYLTLVNRYFLDGYSLGEVAVELGVSKDHMRTMFRTLSRVAQGKTANDGILRGSGRVGRNGGNNEN